jgi:enterochelin esterase-like enzyme
MEPDSALLVVVLLVGAAALIYAIVRLRRWIFRVPVAALAMTLCVLAGFAFVNDYYGYYQSWSQLSADVSGDYAHYTTTSTGNRAAGAVRSGQLRALRFVGAASGIARPGLVYLPPQYGEPRYATTRFPVVELLHGTPGRPTDYVVHMDVVRLLDRMISHHLIGPMIVVLPTMSVGRHFEECVDSGPVKDDTYISSDVRRDVVARFRASRDAAQWGLAGYSSGGYCAANLALRHPSAFGAAGIMDGYFRPSDGPAAAALHFDRSAEQANDPIALARALSVGAHPLPSLWVAAGTGDAADFAGAQAFVAALHGVERVDLTREPGAGHNFYAWRPALARVLAWMWTQLAPPDLRVQFPISGSVSNTVIPVDRRPVVHAAGRR